MAGEDRAGFRRGRLGSGQGEADNWNGGSTSWVGASGSDSKGPPQTRAGTVVTDRLTGEAWAGEGPWEMGLTPFS